MTRYVSVREVSHLRLSMPTDDCWVDQLNWIPVSSSEYHLACRHFPFAMRIENQRPELGLLVHPRYFTSPLLDASGKWRGAYRPIGLRCFPFVARDLRDDPLTDITIVADSKYLSPSNGIPFLEKGGQPGKLLVELHRLLGLLQRGREMFADALDQFLIAGLLLPLADNTNADAEPPLYIIDQIRLAQMDHAALGAMARRKFLSVDLALAWAFSLQNLRGSYLPNQSGRSHHAASAALAATTASKSILIDDLSLVLDDGELVSLASIGLGSPELASPN